MSDRTCIWIQSDLQLDEPEAARSVLHEAVEDIRRLSLPLAGVWCLGDALAGSDLDDLEQVAETTVQLLERLDVPICYVLGNHEMDARRELGVNHYPLYELTKNRPGWHTLRSLSDFYFSQEWFGYQVYFFGDHAAIDGSWFTSHGVVQDDPASDYPHLPSVYRRLRDEMMASSRPILTASHYAYPGGQRHSTLHEQLLPLSSMVRGHFYGHAHIGDLVFNSERPWDRKNPIIGHELIQYNISALESLRSPGSHSAVLSFEAGGCLRLRIRCHLQKEWIDEFWIA